MAVLGSENGSPWWSRSIIQMGPMVIMSIVFLGVLVGLIPSPLLRIPTIEQNEQRIMEDHEKMRAVYDVMLNQLNSTTTTGGELQAKVAALSLRQEETARLLRAICRNTAKNDFTKDVCDR